MNKNTNDIISSAIKREAILRTYEEMLRRHPDQKKVLDVILKVKLEKLHDTK